MANPRLEQQFVEKLCRALGDHSRFPSSFVDDEKIFRIRAGRGSVSGNCMQALADDLNKAAHRRIATVFDDSATDGAKGYKLEVNVALGATLLLETNDILIRFAQTNAASL